MKQKVKEIVIEAIKKAYPEVEVPDFVVEDADIEFGDYSTNVAMILAKVVGEQPQEIAEKIKKELSKTPGNV